MRVPKFRKPNLAYRDANGQPTRLFKTVAVLAAGADALSMTAYASVAENPSPAKQFVSGQMLPAPADVKWDSLQEALEQLSKLERAAYDSTVQTIQRVRNLPAADAHFVAQTELSGWVAESADRLREGVSIEQLDDSLETRLAEAPTQITTTTVAPAPAFPLTAEQLRAAVPTLDPRAAARMLPSVLEAFRDAAIDNPARAAAFLAQLAERQADPAIPVSAVIDNEDLAAVSGELQLDLANDDWLQHSSAARIALLGRAWTEENLNPYADLGAYNYITLKLQLRSDAEEATIATSPTGINVDQMRAVFSDLPENLIQAYLPHLNQAMAEFQINNPARVMAFLAQIGHESVGLTHFEEIASGAAYEGRAGLGNTQPGDGVRYKGRGPIQTTGRNNYRTAGQALGLDLENHPEMVATKEIGFRTSAFFWAAHGLNELADVGDFHRITRIINGGYNGLEDRERRLRTTQVVAATLPGGPVPLAPLASASYAQARTALGV